MLCSYNVSSGLIAWISFLHSCISQSFTELLKIQGIDLVEAFNLPPTWFRHSGGGGVYHGLDTDTGRGRWGSIYHALVRDTTRGMWSICHRLDTDTMRRGQSTTELMDKIIWIFDEKEWLLIYIQVSNVNMWQLKGELLKPLLRAVDISMTTISGIIPEKLFRTFFCCKFV